MCVDFGRQDPTPLNLTLNNQILSEVKVMKILWIHIQSDLKWDAQVTNMLMKANKQLKFVVLEIGAGVRIPTVRENSEKLMKKLPMGQARLIRINPVRPAAFCLLPACSLPAYSIAPASLLAQWRSVSMSDRMVRCCCAFSGL